MAKSRSAKKKKSEEVAKTIAQKLKEFILQLIISSFKNSFSFTISLFKKGIRKVCG